jgi:hypothetical protein
LGCTRKRLVLHDQPEAVVAVLPRISREAVHRGHGHVAGFASGGEVDLELPAAF